MMFNQQPQVVFCPRCGLIHWSNQACPSIVGPSDSLHNALEDAEIRRWSTFMEYDKAARRGHRRGEALARLDAALRNL